MRNVLLVTMVTRLNPVAAASHVAVVTTSNHQILSHVTGGLGSVSNVSTTLRDLSVQCARVATMGMLLVATAGVSKVVLFNFFSDAILSFLFPCLKL